MRAELLDIVGGDEDLLHEISALFLEDAPGRLATLKDALNARDGRALYRAAHAIKGSASNFSVPAIVEAALRVEALAIEGQIDAAAAATARLETLVDALLDELRAL
jgi:HPt (histidine-containing phosphotransfer) domain-containing protein